MSIWQQYEDQGVIVYAIGPDDELATLINFRDQMGITFPILHDPGGTVHDQYTQQNEVNAAYPEDWVIGADGVVRYVNTVYDVDAMIAAIESDL